MKLPTRREINDTSERVWRPDFLSFFGLSRLIYDPRRQRGASAAWEASRVLLSLTWLSVIWVCVCVCLCAYLHEMGEQHKREGPLIKRLTRLEGWVSRRTATEVNERDSPSHPHPFHHFIKSSGTRLRLNFQEHKKTNKNKKTSISCTLRNIPHNLHFSLCVLTMENLHIFIILCGWGRGRGPDASDGTPFTSPPLPQTGWPSATEVKEPQKRCWEFV